MWDFLLTLLKTYGLYTLLLVGIFVWIALYWYKHDGSLEKFLSTIMKVLSFFKIGYDFFDKKRIKYSFESAIKSTISEMSNNMQYVKSYPCQVEWIEADEAESSLNNGIVFLRIKKSNRGSDNMVMALYLYVSAVFFPELKKVLSPEQKEAIDLFITHLFTMRMDDFHRNSFNRCLAPQLENKYIVNFNYRRFNDIYKHGYFHTIFMPEINYIEKSEAARIDSIDVEQLHSDIDSFVDMIQGFANRKDGSSQDEPWKYNGRYIKTFFVIFAKHESLADITPHLDYIEDLIDDGLNRCYVSSKRVINNARDSLCKNLDHKCFVDGSYPCRTILHRTSGDVDCEIHITILQKKALSN